MPDVFFGLFRKVFGSIPGGIYIYLWLNTDTGTDPFQTICKKIIQAVTTEEASPIFNRGEQSGHYMDLVSMDGYRFDVYFASTADTLYNKSTTNFISKILINGWNSLYSLPYDYDGFAAFNDGVNDYGYLLNASVATWVDPFTVTISINRFDFSADILGYTDLVLTPLPDVTLDIDAPIELPTHKLSVNTISSYGVPSPDGKKVAYTILSKRGQTDLTTTETRYLNYTHVVVLDLVTMSLSIAAQGAWFTPEYDAEFKIEKTCVTGDFETIATLKQASSADTLSYPITGGFDSASNFSAAMVDVNIVNNGHVQSAPVRDVTDTYDISVTSTLTINGTVYDLGENKNLVTSTIGCTPITETSSVNRHNVSGMIRVINIQNKEFLLKEAIYDRMATSTRTWVFNDPDYTDTHTFDDVITCKTLLSYYKNGVEKILLDEECSKSVVGEDIVVGTIYTGPLLCTLQCDTDSTTFESTFHSAELIKNPYLGTIQTIVNDNYTNNGSIDNAYLTTVRTDLGNYLQRIASSIGELNTVITEPLFSGPLSSMISAAGDDSIIVQNNFLVTNFDLLPDTEPHTIRSKLQNFADYTMLEASDSHATVMVNGVVLQDVEWTDGTWIWPPVQMSIRV